MMETESWCPVADAHYGKFYEVSDLGRVRRTTSRTSGKAGKIRRPGKLTHGYEGYVLCSPRKSVQGHVLVLEAFVGPRPPGADACHNDGNRSNNRLTNLRWDTKSANARDKFRHDIASGEMRFTAMTPERVRYIRDSKEPTRKLAEELGINRCVVNDIRAERAWSWLR